MLFIRAVAAEDKASAIKRGISGEFSDRFTPTLSQFKEIPGTPFAYWIGAGVRAAFNRFPPVEGHGRAVRVGLQTSDDFRFLRAHWEIDTRKRGKKWFPFAKGGELSPYYACLHLTINWEEEGKELKAWVVSNPTDPRTVHWSRRIASSEYYLRPGMTWPLRASRFAPQPMPSGCIFSVRGYSVFLPESMLMAGLSIFNSKPFDYLFKALLGRFGYPEFIVGALQKLPWAEPSAEQAKTLSDLAKSAWSATRAADTAVETSLAFTLPKPLNISANADISATLAETQSKIDAVVYEIFGLDESDRQEIEGASVFVSAEIVADVDENEDQDTETSSDDNDRIALQSWAVGVAFGRFDIRLATGERAIPAEPEPFDALPDTSPGMVPDGEAPFMPCKGVLVDDPGHADDLTARVNAVYECVGQQALEEATLRRSLAREFFPAHLKMYTKSSRKAPIYWQLATPSGSYSVWLYLHELDRDMFFRVQSDYVSPKLLHEQRQLEELRNDAGPSPNAAQRKVIDTQERFTGELQNLLEEVRRVAPIWKPIQDDGVVLTMAPLWRLMTQHKAWQKELKAKWDDLAVGKFDWSHIAMHLWPERVVPKCATDRSLAIAHGLDDVFWTASDDGKWNPRPTPQRPIDELVHERTSSAVKSALKELFETTVSNGPKARTRRSSS
ncbi:type II restriction endonuclease subunit M [Rhizobium leguminosarum bv. viciae]|uniref:Type II restriction endonuclease subunit M n=1 Tax=Rhizobium leguminosarum bv. viciae TaxID=387 RepID=A0A8I2GNE2_RHILV|nr:MULTISPECIES: type II restriction endonuclease subunit M [Rhizobium]MBY3108077.1 type II restriction endonuclease subunit M [Rhizobium laguerreae]NKM43412.1 type II restriction endonuclease subunit M [Rhizobium leguminosarum bv. viciae]